MKLDEVLRRQSGVITTRQAVEVGLSEQAVRRRVRSGAWKRLSVGVHLVGGHPHTGEVRVRAAVAACGSAATAHGLTAAWWHGFVAHAPEVLDVTIPHRQRAPRVPGVRVRRRDLHRNDVARRRHLQVTATPLTVLEAMVGGAEGAVLLDRALQQWVDLEMLDRVHQRNLGRRGSAAAGELLTVAADGAASQAERLLHRLLRRAGIAGWQAAYHCLGYEIDVAFPDQQLALEVDGWAWHSTAGRFRADRHRQNVLSNAGWRVLRFTWHDLTGTPDSVLAQIRAALKP